MYTNVDENIRNYERERFVEVTAGKLMLVHVENGLFVNQIEDAVKLSVKTAVTLADELDAHFKKEYGVV